MNYAHASEGRKMTAAAVIGAMLIAVGQTLASGQAAPQQPANPAANVGSRGAASDDNVFMWADRAVLQQLSGAKELLRQGRYGEAARRLGGVVEASEDYFIPHGDGSAVFRSLKAEANRLIGKMPASGRESYELQYGPRAKQLLDQAIARGDAGGLAEVSRRFFHTQAGYQATLLLGLDNLDRGNPLAGALALERLRDVGGEATAFEPTLSLAAATCWLQAGQPETARRVLLALREARPAATVTLGGRSAPLFAAGVDPVAWLTAMLGPQRPAEALSAENWTVFRGNAARNASAPGSAPLLSPRWRIPVTDDPLLENDLLSVRQMYRDRGVSEAAALHPLVVNDVVLLRTVRNLLAVDLQTGKRLWEAPTDDLLESPLNSSAGQLVLEQAPQFPIGLQQRIWDDQAYGTLSSDGRLVFSIEDLGLASGVNLGRMVIGLNGMRRPDPTAPQDYNRLTAHDIRTGKLKWHLGGGRQPRSLRQAGAFFLGPPLPLAGRLYAIVEENEEIRLLAIDAQRGEPLWSQQLAVVEQDITKDLARRLSGATPSYADGVLVCPTATGAVVGVELSTRSLLWGYRYSRRQESGAGASAMRRMSMLRGEDPTDNWNDSSVVIADGKVLFSCADTDQIHCLSLLDGKPLWRRPVNNALFVACVLDGMATLVGRREVTALSLADGTPAWDDRKVVLPDEALPSGQGFLSGHTYYLPLSTAQVAAIDVRSGRLGRVSRSRGGVVPGNLAPYKGFVLSQGVEGLDCCHQIDSLRAVVDRRLAANPNDAEALAQRGEILLDDDHRNEAVECLRRSYAIAAEARPKELLRDALIGGLEFDFPSYRRHSAELERLLDDPQQQAVYLRLMAAGLRTAREWDEALRRYAELIDRQRGPLELENVARHLSVRSDVWIHSQLTSLRSALSADDAKLVDRFVAQRWQALGATPGVEKLERFWQYFGGLPAAAPAQAALVKEYVAQRRLIEAERLLLADYNADDAPQTAAALAAWAEMLRNANRNHEAALLYKRLGERYADVVCAEEKTGRQLVDALPADDPVRAALAARPAWPLGKVEVRRSHVPRSPMASYGRFALRYAAPRGPLFEKIQLQYDQSRSALAARDEFGKTVWQVSLADQSRGRSYGFNQSGATVKTAGHLVVLSLEMRTIALDALNDGAPGPRILWTQELAERTAVASRMPTRRRAQAGMRWGFMDPFQGGWSGAGSALGPMTERVVCLQRGRELLAVHPIGGETLWTRGDLPPGCTLLGDDEYLFLLPSGQTEATALRTADGAQVGRRTIPPTDQWVLTLGRHVVQWEPGSDCKLRRFDPWEQRDVWTRSGFDDTARCYAPNADTIAVLEGTGRFQVFSAADGRTLLSARVEPLKELQEIFVQADDHGYCLIANQAHTAQTENAPMQQMPGVMFRPVQQALAYAFDREGKPLWKEPAKIVNQHYLLDQPVGLPVLVFACQSYQRKLATGQFVSKLLCIDKRTGRTIFRGDLGSSTGVFEVFADAEKSLVEIRLQQDTIQLKFTDQPISANDPVDAGEPAAETSILDAILRAAEAALQESQTPGKRKAAAGKPAAAEKPAAPPAKGAPKP